MHEITQNYTNVAYYICFTPRILEADSYIAILLILEMDQA
jgi:hypothetical protein